MVVLPFLSHVHTKPDIFETAFFLSGFVWTGSLKRFTVKSPEVMSSDIFGLVARYSFMWLQILSRLTTS